MDPADQAQRLIEQMAEEIEERIRRQRLRQEHGTALTHCIECGDELPELRRQMGKGYCVACQTEREKNGGHQGV